MKINNFNYRYYLTNSNDKKIHNSYWTTRTEARDEKRKIKLLPEYNGQPINIVRETISWESVTQVT